MSHRRRSLFLVILVLILPLVLLDSISAQTPTKEIEGLFQAFLLPAIAVGAAAIGSLAYMLFRFREGRGGEVKQYLESRRAEIVWVTASALVIIYVAIISTATLYSIENPPEGEPATEITVIAKQWSWEFIYPNGTSAFRTLEVKAGEVVKLTLVSQDVAHSFYVKDLRFKIDAIPGTNNTFWFRATEPGEYVVQCAEFCGTGHSIMRGTMVVKESQG